VSFNTWVIGSGGLLGSALRHTVVDSFDAKPIRWGDQDESGEDLKANLKVFTAQLDPNHPWRIIWAAGQATVSSSEDKCRNELTTFSEFVNHVQEHLTTAGRFFLTSSAGGVYAGSSDPPFNAESVPVPTSAYGRLKLDQEKILTVTFKGRVDVHTTIGRISNLYGPGQNLGKLQGLISHLILAALSKRAMNMFVPLDTIRDFLFVEDAAGNNPRLDHHGLPTQHRSDCHRRAKKSGHGDFPSPGGNSGQDPHRLRAARQQQRPGS
jgi:UDP-glucose 4-epimerase